MAGTDTARRRVRPAESSSPARAGLVLVALIAVAAVANLNLAVANVALPDVGRAFNSSQTACVLSPRVTRETDAATHLRPTLMACEEPFAAP
jgi:hypothetical protein